MILGCGVDLMEVARFEREVARRGDGLAEELFSASERAWCRRRRRPAEGYAMAYAAKEALFKALGTGKVGRMAWNDIEVEWPEGASQPTMALAGETAEVARQLEVTGVHCAVTSTREYAAAWVVVAGADARRESVVSSQKQESRSKNQEDEISAKQAFLLASDNRQLALLASCF